MFRKEYTLIVILPIFFIAALSCRKKPVVGTTTEPTSFAVTLNESQIQLANIHTASPREGTIARKLSLTGILKVNEESAFTISSRTPGRIEKLYFKNTGETVRKGDKLYQFYSEDLISAQREYFTLQSNNWNFNKKYEPSLAIENKLLIMGMVPDQIQDLADSGKISFLVDIFSTVEGKIRSVNVSEGEYITPGQILYELASDNKLWIEAQIYPDDVQYLRPGTEATASFPLSGENSVNCTISFVSPAFEKGKNITLARAVIDNPGNRLHPGMYAALTVWMQASRGIIVPASSVISVPKGEIVWVKDGKGIYSSRFVKTGIQSDDSVMVLSGLSLSDQIVTSGTYLLNSELTLKQGTELNHTTEKVEKGSI